MAATMLRDLGAARFDFPHWLAWPKRMHHEAALTFRYPGAFGGFGLAQLNDGAVGKLFVSPSSLRIELFQQFARSPHKVSTRTSPIKREHSGGTTGAVLLIQIGKCIC
jgi:hypothetical protein